MYYYMAANVRFQNADAKGGLSSNYKNSLKILIMELFISEGKILNKIDYIFCSDNYLLQINKEFLQHDFFTDIISFDLSEGQNINGEIYISLDRVKENAITHVSSFKNELCRVIIHGALHLCGYNDKKKSEKTTMRMKEDYYLQLFEEKSK